MPISVKIKLFIGVFLSVFFMLVDFWFKVHGFVFHVGPFFVGIILVSAVLDAYKNK